jgi:hypothetical protein
MNDGKEKVLPFSHRYRRKMPARIWELDVEMRVRPLVTQKIENENEYRASHFLLGLIKLDSPSRDGDHD